MNYIVLDMECNQPWPGSPSAATKNRSRHWADSHRDLHGFEWIFSSTTAPVSLGIHPVFTRSPVAAVKKNLPFKTAKHSKTRDFLQDKIKFHGKADACRGILLQYLGKKIRFGAYKSLCEAALRAGFFPIKAKRNDPWLPSFGMNVFCSQGSFLFTLII